MTQSVNFYIPLTGLRLASLLYFFVTLSSAHTPEGHERIEKEAYKLLKNQPASVDLPSGLEIFQFLVNHHVIKDNDQANSSYPDLDLGRQFLSDRQIFHFMADNRYVVDAIRDYKDLESQKAYVLSKALPDCLMMVYTLLREVVDNPKGANEAGRGVYVLMHAIMDSYSREHTIRDSQTYDIEVIKSWQLSRLYWPKGTKIEEAKVKNRADTYVFLHTNAGLGDADWADNSGKLNSEALQAVLAVKDLLVTIYRSMQNSNSQESVIKKYISTYFKPKNAQLINDRFEIKNIVIPITYKEGYMDNTNVLILDRYPLFSHMVTTQTGFNEKSTTSIGYELSYHLVPGGAISSTSFFKRLPYGLSLSVNENTNILSNTNVVESFQFKAMAKTLIYLPLRNLVLEPRIGISSTPFLNDGIDTRMVTGFDLAFNLGRDNERNRTKRFAVGYENNTIGNQNYNFISLKIGFNNWQGRLVK